MARIVVLGMLFCLHACAAAESPRHGDDEDSGFDAATALDTARARDTTGDGEEDAEPAPYVATGDPFSPGSLTVESWTFTEEDGAPVELLVFAPTTAGRYPLVQFQHGFLNANHWYQDVLRHVASHGFVVVAPQMYPADGIPLQKPTAFEEAIDAARVLQWSRTELAGRVGPAELDDIAGLAGHSRGGKVTWALLRDDPEAVLAVVGIDPVDGQGGPLGGEDRVLDGTAIVSLPTLIVGTGLGPEPVDGPFAYACAPEGDNHEQFWAAVAGAGWHVLVPGYGHNDMLDAVRTDCEPLCDELCPGGAEPELMRQLTGGLLAAFFRVHLQGDEASRDVLKDEGAMPLPVAIETRP